jgi:putative acetyltransferase
VFIPIFKLTANWIITSYQTLWKNMVRVYKTSDLESVISVFHRSVREVASRDYSPAQIAVWTQEPTDFNTWSKRLDSGGVFINELDSEMIGFTRVDESGYVDLLYVHPAFQRQGVASELFKQLLDWASNRGIPMLTSEVSITARLFFESVGFRVVRTQEVERQGIQFRNFRMERDIDSDIGRR